MVTQYVLILGMTEVELKQKILIFFFKSKIGIYQATDYNFLSTYQFDLKDLQHNQIFFTSRQPL